jgi:hypothetical protein
MKWIDVVLLSTWIVAAAVTFGQPASEPEVLLSIPWPLIAKGGIMLGSWLLGRKGGQKAGQPSPESQQSIKNILDLSQQARKAATTYGDYSPGFLDQATTGFDRGRFLLDEAAGSARGVPDFLGQARGTFDRAETALQPALKYTQGLLKGGPAAMQAIAPEVGATQAGYESGRQALSQFAPRGGGRAATIAELPFQQQRDVTNLLSQARQFGAKLAPELAGHLTQIGAGRTGLAQTQLQLADVQRSIGATEADIGAAAGRLGIGTGQLQALLLSVAQRGPEAILNFDIRNREFIYKVAKEGAAAGANIVEWVWKTIQDMGWGGLGGSDGSSSGNTLIDLLNKTQLDEASLGGKGQFGEKGGP